MAMLTEAQAWALQAIADGYGESPAYLGQRMMERPGVEEKRRGGSRSSPQGLGRVDGTMMHRLERMGLTTVSYGSRSHWHPGRASLTPAGRLALSEQGERSDG